MDAPDLITLEMVRLTRGLNDSSEDTSSPTVDDSLLIQFIHAASAWAWARTGRHFVPYVGTRTYDGQGQHLQQSSTCLDLDDDLLALTACSDNGTALLLTDLVVENANFTPYWRIRHKPSTGLRWGGDATLSSIAVTGTWGFHDDYARAWKPVATLAAGIDDATTTLLLDNTADIGTLSYLKVNDEFMQVTFKPEDSSGILVDRGVRGTTAAAALNGATVSVFNVVNDIAHATLRLVNFYYDRRDTVGDRVSFAGQGMFLEGAIPLEIISAFDARKRLSVMFM